MHIWLRILLGISFFWNNTYATDINPNTGNDTLNDLLELTSYSQRASWPYLSPSRAIAIRTQRDIFANNSIAYNVLPGVDLSTVLFEPFGYNATSLATFQSLLQVGFQTFVIDLYYNELTKTWLLCPQDQILQQSSTQCSNSNFGFQQLLSILDSFILATNNDLNTNVMHLLLNLHSLDLPTNTTSTINSNFTTSNTYSLSNVFDIVNNAVSPSYIDPLALPSLHTLLFRYKFRVFPIINEYHLSNSTSYNILNDSSTLFASTNSINSISPINETNFKILNFNFDRLGNLNPDLQLNSSVLSFSYDNATNPYTYASYAETIRSGYSPIINHPFKDIKELSFYLEISSWSWAAFQPTITNFDQISEPYLLQDLIVLDWWEGYNATNKSSSNDSIYATNVTDYETYQENSENDDDDEYINRCAVITQYGWVATSCDRKAYPICYDITNSTNYYILNEKVNYQKAEMACKYFDSNYNLALPKNFYEQNSIISLFNSTTEGYWININSLSSENCWVEGSNTNCPYQKIVSRHIFIQMITPASTFTVVLLLLLILLQLHGLPVHKNRRYWKNLLNETLKNDYDGVPS